MSEIMKHIGHIANTGKRCAIVFLQIPERDDHALVVDTEAIPERIHDPLMSIIRSNESQQARNLGDVLIRRMLPDSNISLLQELHQLGYLQAQPVSNVNLSPRPNTVVSLKEVLEAMGQLSNKESQQNQPTVTETNAVVEPTVAEQLQESYQEAPATPVGSPEATTVNQVTASERGIFSSNSQQESAEENFSVAQGMLAQADLMEADAADLRRKAYNLAPSLAPTESPKVEPKTSKTTRSTKKSSEESQNEQKTTRTTSTRGRRKKSTT